MRVVRPHQTFTISLFLSLHHTPLAQNDNLPIHEEKAKGVYVKGLLEVFVGSMDEVFEAMRQGQSARMVASTSKEV